MLQGSVAGARLQQATRAKSQQMFYPIGSALGLLGLWMVILLLSYPAESCMETAWSNGRLVSDDTVIKGFTLDSTDSGSCRCCALCYHHPTCASLSFNSQEAKCELYSSVASYATLKPDEEKHWTYFVLPGRSKHEQFCLHDSDCLKEGDACRGRVCTDRETVTCRVICEELGAGQRYGGDIPRMYGWLNGQSLMLTCWMSSSTHGFTQLLSSTSGFPFTRDTVLDYNRALNPDTKQRSILGLAEDLRHSNDDAYTIEIWVEWLDFWYVLAKYQLPSDKPVLGESPREVVELEQEVQQEVEKQQKDWTRWRATQLYKPQSGPNLVSINADITETQDKKWRRGTLAREDGAILFDWFHVFIRE